MATAAEIQARIDAIDAALADVSVVKATSFSDQSTTFRDLGEIAEERARLVAQLAVAAGTSRTRYAAFDRSV
jgi:hypothetical protein